MLFLSLFLTDPIKAEEHKSNRDKYYGKNTDPHKNARNAVRVKVYKEIGVNKRGGRGRNKDRRIKLQDNCLNKKEDRIGKRERNGSDGIVPLRFLALVEQEEIQDIHNGKNDVEQKTTDAPVELRITSCRACEHNVKDKEGKQNAEHTDKLQKRRRRNCTILFLFDRLDQRGEHNADAKKVTDIGEVYVEIPTDHMDVIKDTKACDTAHKAERAINGLENELRGSVFNHNVSLFLLFSLNVMEYNRNRVLRFLRLHNAPPSPPSEIALTF